MIRDAFLDAGGIRTHYLEAGDGPPLVLLHGGGIGIDSALTWSSNIVALAERFHVIAFDQLGFGKTDMPTSIAQFTKRHRAEHAKDVLAVLGLERPVLVGHSEGGLIAAMLAISAPDQVEKLVLVASGATSPILGGTEDKAWLAASAAAYDWAPAVESEDAYLDAFRRHMLYFPKKINENLFRGNYRHATDSGNLDLFVNAPPDYTEVDLYYAVAREDVHPHLASLDIETHLIWASEDATVPVNRGLALMRMMRRAQMHVLNRSRHMLMIDASEDFNQLLISMM